MSKQPVYFLQCPRCHTWRYTLKIVDKLKCLHCSKTFDFSSTKKELYEVESVKHVPDLIKRIKMQDASIKDYKTKTEFEYLYGAKK